MTKIWIKKKREATDLPALLARAMQQRAPQEVYSKIMQQQFRVVPNTEDNREGFFVVFDKPQTSGGGTVLLLVLGGLTLLWVLFG